MPGSIGMAGGNRGFYSDQGTRKKVYIIPIPYSPITDSLIIAV
jgi:hypothetical protein